MLIKIANARQRTFSDRLLATLPESIFTVDFTYTCGSGGEVHLGYGSINGTKASAGLIAAPANTKDLTWSVPEVSLIIGDTYSATGPLSIDGRTAFTSSMNFGPYQLSSSFN